MSSCLIDPFSQINSIGDPSMCLIDQFTNINSVTTGSGTNILPGLGLYQTGNFFNVGVDNSTIQINGSDLLEVKDSGITNVKLQNSDINFTSSDGISFDSSSIELGGTIEINVDNTVIRTNKTVLQTIENNLSLGDCTESTSTTTGSLIVCGGIGVSGNINSGGVVTATEINASSDRRLKKEIEILNNSLELVNKIKPCSYKWRKIKGKKRDEKINFGVIAQELEEIGLENIVNNNNKYKSVNYTQLIPLLINSVQELSKKIENLEKKF